MTQGVKHLLPRGLTHPWTPLPKLRVVKTVAPPWGPLSAAAPLVFFREPAPLTSQLTKVARLQTVISLK